MMKYSYIEQSDGTLLKVDSNGTIVGKYEPIVKKEPSLISTFSGGLEYESPVLLKIILNDEESVPTVTYKGKDIKWKQRILFDWTTATDTEGGLTYIIDNLEHISYMQPNRIERKKGCHASED